MSSNAPKTSNDSMEQIPRYKEGTFTNLERIGEGGQATAYKGEFRKTRMQNFFARPSRLVAMKKYHITISMAATSTELREIEILIKANNKHPRIVQLFGITIDKYDKTACSGYIMEYMQNGSLDRVIHDNSINYGLNQIYSWLYQAASGIMYLHKQNIIHRDIKPSNLLLGDTLDDLKVADFGLARHALGESSITKGIGTYSYTAPEVFQTGKYNNAADVYSFTTTIWEIFHRKKPLDEFKDNITEIIVKLPSKVIEGWHPAIESSCVEPHMERLLERGWHKDPHQRIKFKEILDAVQPTILVLGREYWNPYKMYLLKGDRTQWSTLSLNLPTSFYCGGAVYLDGEIYIFGLHFSDKKTYKLKRGMKWIQLADMNEGRKNISSSSIAFDGCIWVFGGYHNSERHLNSVEKSMKEKRQFAAAAACKGKLFVCGGSNDEPTFRFLISIECFDPVSQKWTIFLDFPSPTRGHALISDGICLTVLGGWGENKSVWKINPSEEKATWKKLPQLRERRRYFTANLLGDSIFAIGGEKCKKVEFFNGETWEYGPELPEEIQGMCSIVIPAHLAAALSSRQ